MTRANPEPYMLVAEGFLFDPSIPWKAKDRLETLAAHTSHADDPIVEVSLADVRNDYYPFKTATSSRKWFRWLADHDFIKIHRRPGRANQYELLARTREAIIWHAQEVDWASDPAVVVDGC